MVDHRDWVTRAADEAVERAGSRRDGGPVVCASGISPSGPIHLGNLREIMVPHLVAEEIKSRGVPCVHILSWDDYDRLRKVPAGVPAGFEEHIGRPLSAVPDPWGEYESWAERFKAPFREALRRLGIEIREISQTEMYRSGAYADSIARAIAASSQIDAVLARYRTLRVESGTETQEDQEEEASAASSSAAYFPYRPYCDSCGRDTTTVQGFDQSTGAGSYTCSACGNEGEFSIRGPATGKLVWKVDWPMRWAYENVAFEAGGVDHSSPGSSFTVGSQIVRDVFGGEPPVYLPYSFVGARGMAKLSGSKGAAPTPTDALRVLEPAILRWIYARRRPNQAITVDFGQEVLRVYDEWDALCRRVDSYLDSRASGQQAGGQSVDPGEIAVVRRSRATHDHGPVTRPRKIFPFRLLSSICDITADNPEQMLRILRQADTDDADFDLADLQPRLDCARAWTREHVPADQRTIVRTEPDHELLDSLSAEEHKSLALLVDGLEEHWSLEGLTTLVYGVPKMMRGLPADAPATPELKQAQRAFFILVYRLLVSRDTGPRLPTLLLALGPDRIRHLLTRR